MDIDTSINFQYISRHPLRVVAGEKQQSRSYIFREKAIPAQGKGGGVYVRDGFIDAANSR
jgi:hypothetical protein